MSMSMISDRRSYRVNTTGQKTQKGGATYRGSLPATDPIYKSGWNYLSGKNLNPHSGKPSSAPNQPPKRPPKNQRPPSR